MLSHALSQRFSQVLNVHVRFRCGASVVYSEGGGVPGLIQREVNPKLLRVHCLSHRCALVLKDSVEKSEWALWCDEIMHDIINPFARSSKRC